MRSRRAALAAALLGVLVARAGVAAPRADPSFNPQPAADDLVLPMPGGLEMAFRRIEVPGRDFWFDPDREVRLGDATSDDPHARERTVRVTGAFLDPAAGRWWYPIGKYEVSKAQFAAVLGDGDPARGLARLAELSGDPKDKEIAGLAGRARELKLAEPVRWLGWLAVQEFVHRYNRWLLDDPARSRSLPALVWQVQGQERRMPGFLRLPTEIEWEYAARGGGAVRVSAPRRFEAPLPFEEAEFEGHAWLADNARNQVRPIGTRKPVHGLHDMLGNVAELTTDLFQAELGLGKPGGLAVRGGSAFTKLEDVKLGARYELTLFQPDDAKPGRLVETRSPFVGFRLVVGAPVKPDAAYSAELEASFEQYARRFRANANVATSGTAASILQSSQPIREVQQELERLGRREPRLAAELVAMQRRLQQVETLQDREIRTIAGDLVVEAARSAAIFGRNHCRLEHARATALPAAERLAKVGTEHQGQHRDLLRQLEERERFQEDELGGYLERVRRLVSYGRAYAGEAIERAERRAWPTDYERRAFALVRRHLGAALEGRLEPGSVRRELGREFAWQPGGPACV